MLRCPVYLQGGGAEGGSSVALTPSVAPRLLPQPPNPFRDPSMPSVAPPQCFPTPHPFHSPPCVPPQLSLAQHLARLLIQQTQCGIQASS